jgi:hypothetical protein
VHPYPELLIEHPGGTTGGLDTKPLTCVPQNLIHPAVRIKDKDKPVITGIAR